MFVKGGGFIEQIPHFPYTALFHSTTKSWLGWGKNGMESWKGHKGMSGDRLQQYIRRVTEGRHLLKDGELFQNSEVCCAWTGYLTRLLRESCWWLDGDKLVVDDTRG